MLPFRNFLGHHCSCKQMKYKTLTVSSLLNRKTSLTCERQFTTFSCSCFRSTRLFASMRSFRKASRIISTLGRHVMFTLIVAALFNLVMLIGPVIFTIQNAALVGERAVFGKQFIPCRLLFLVPGFPQTHLLRLSHKSPLAG